ncbi:CsbD family protein [Paracoccus aestuarii]|uniref:CsbD family protein n=1 Tax=Paracoccus aestuarii TaxID=453842 RepID=A0A419A0H4_9RHOB|nr:CsbD family protein [Paracoccus aestuarii]RJL06442.1 CsbD family protein [Paracoccus aestuarii]WCQ99352.1 CsbD family protein [Paracoccus aestuarii]
MGEMTDKLKAAGNKTAGSVKDGIGSMTGNTKLQAEGKAQKAKGEVQSATGTVKGKLGDDI